MTRQWPPDYPLDTLTALNMEEMLKAFQLHSRHGVRWLARHGIYPLVRQLSGVVLDYDMRVGEQGLTAASQWLMSQVTGGIRVSGQGHIPAQGPLLVVSNHPGLTDAMAIFATLGREDLRIIAADRGLLRLLPNIERYLIYVSEFEGERVGALRAVAQHLRAGGAVLTFPYGAIERDPALYADAAETLAGWSHSSTLLARLVPGLQVLPVIASGVLSPAALRHPITHLYRTPKDRDWVAASLQFLLRRYQNNIVQLAYGQPVCASDDLHSAVVTQARHMLRASLAPLPQRAKQHPGLFR